MNDLRCPNNWSVNNLSESHYHVMPYKRCYRWNSINSWIIHKNVLTLRTWIPNQNCLDYSLVTIIYSMSYHRSSCFKVGPMLICTRESIFKTHSIIETNGRLEWRLFIQCVLRTGCNVLVLNRYYKSNRQMDVDKFWLENLLIIRLINFDPIINLVIS